MLVYRVFPYLPGASPDSPGGPLFLRKEHQGQGRLDNPDRYLVYYVARDQQAAVGETFGDWPVWRDSMLDFPRLPGARRAIGVYTIPDTANLLDLDDGANLKARALRPSRVVARQRRMTQAWALSIFEERAFDGSRTWDGVRWWSRHEPEWPVVGLWTDSLLKFERVEDLSMGHVAVKDAAAALRKQVV